MGSRETYLETTLTFFWIFGGDGKDCERPALSLPSRSYFSFFDICMHMESVGSYTVLSSYSKDNIRG